MYLLTYLLKQATARSLCDSWASCYAIPQHCVCPVWSVTR